MTTANKVTIARILAVPLFIIEWISYTRTGAGYHWWSAVIIFFAAAISDGIDGYIARRFKQFSELGTILDPLADKLLLISAIILLSLPRPFFHPIPLWLTVTILSRDGLLLLGMLVAHFLGIRMQVKPHLTGKAATVLQMASIIGVLLKFPEGMLRWMFLAAGLCTLISAIVYVRYGLRQINATSKSDPSSPSSQK